MTKPILLIHKVMVQHYRVPVYNYLSAYLETRGYKLIVISNGIESVNPHPVKFELQQVPLGVRSLTKICMSLRPCAVIFFVNLSHHYLFPLLLLLKLSRIRTIYWGHGIDLGDKKARFKNFLYGLEHRYFDALILYAEHLKSFIAPRYHPKVFVANNTLNLQGLDKPKLTTNNVLNKYGVTTTRNIIYIGRIQQRKRVDDLLAAFRLINNDEVGLILIGPRTDSSIGKIEGERIYDLGPLYDEEVDALIKSADVFCMPGAIGLGIVHAFYFGLPVVTEDVDHGPEIMYLRDGKNGFIVPKGDIRKLAEKLSLLLFDDALRLRFSKAARAEMAVNGSIDKMCSGFHHALDFVCSKR